MKTHVFKDSLNIGLSGKKIVEEYLINRADVLSVNKVNNKYKDKSNIDFIINLKNGIKTSITVKTDTYNTGNIFFETLSCAEKGIDGWLYSCKAEFLFYYCFQTKELYIINIAKYIEWFLKNKYMFKLKIFKNIGTNNKVYTSQGYTVPKKNLEENFREYKKYII